MPRIHHVQRARSAVTCGKCRRTITKGMPYKWAKPFRSGRIIRCDQCPIRASDIATSDKLSRLYAAQEAINDAIGSGDISDIISALEEASNEARDVAQEYTDAGENMAAIREDMEEKASACEDWASALDNAASEIEEFDEDDARGKYDDEKEEGESEEDYLERLSGEHLEEARDKATEAADALSL